MSTENRENLLAEFQTFTQEEKFEKISIYLYAIQKSEKNFIWLYSIFEELWIENIWENDLNNLYSILLDITLIWKDYEESWLDKMASLLQSLKENIVDDSEADRILDNMNNL